MPRSRPAAPPRPQLSPRQRAGAVFLWALAVHAAFLVGSFERDRPASVFLYADSVQYFEQARHLARGLAFNAGLPFHPPATAWLLVPVWWATSDPGTAALLGKALMVLVNAGTYALFYLVARPRLPHAFAICLLLPLNFGELQLSSAVTNDALYRLLLLALFWLGPRLPLVGGALHGLAALTRAEHLPLSLALLAWGLWRPARRRAALQAAGAGALVLLVHLVPAARGIGAYNRAHAAEMTAPLPVVVPVSLYGPLNFALANGPGEIFFSRQSLPPAPDEPALLDPRFPPHQRFLAHGYRVGGEWIAAHPREFLGRAARKLWFSTYALSQGWTWRDLPEGGPWVRQPVDMSHTPSPLYHAVALFCFALGLWSVRHERVLVAAGLGVMAYRLAVNVAFFPYLRSLAVASPFYLALVLLGAAVPLRRHAGRALWALVVVLALVHFAGAPRLRNYRVAGERDAAGNILDDKRLLIVPAGFL